MSDNYKYTDELPPEEEEAAIDQMTTRLEQAYAPETRDKRRAALKRQERMEQLKNSLQQIVVLALGGVVVSFIIAVLTRLTAIFTELLGG